MRDELKKNNIFSRRILVIGGIKAAFFGILISRLGYLQIVKHKEYASKANSNRIRPVLTTPIRGLIFDRNNKPLVKNANNYRLLLYRNKDTDIQKIITNLARILKLTPIEKRQIEVALKKSRYKSVISIVSDIAYDDLARLEVNSYKLKGCVIQSGLKRQYLLDRSTAHILGYVSLPSSNEITQKNRELFLNPDFKIGKTGIEKKYDLSMRGTPGQNQVEINAYGIPLRTLSEKKPQKGQDIHLNIDANLQQYINARLGNLAASATVIDVNDGAILALNSTPSFDPNLFVEGISEETWQQLSQNLKKPLNNKAISALYPPGSVFKLIVAMAALKNGHDFRHKFTCSGKMRFGNRVFHCWKKTGHGQINLIDAIAGSCNIHFYNLAIELGIDKIAETALQFGLNHKFDIGIDGAQSGNIPSDAWKRKIFKQPWQGGDTLNTAIGQGFTLTTPLQLAVLMAQIANGGFKITPHLIKGQNNITKTRLIDPSIIDLVKYGCNMVVNSKKGTAYWHRIWKKNYEMAGKTGTSQVISKRAAELTDAEKEIKAHQNHAIFAGYAPVNKPKFAISVVVEHGGSGSSTAAPIARDILLKTQQIIT